MARNRSRHGRQLSRTGAGARERRHDLDYRRAAWKRFEEAEYLAKGELYTGAVYLAGHAVECMLKGLWLSLLPPSQRQSAYNACRTEIGHNIEELRLRLANCGLRIPARLSSEFTTVLTWGNEMRYLPADESPKTALIYLRAASHLIQWAESSGTW